MRNAFRLLTALCLALAWVIAGPSQAGACACGAFITTEQAVVNGETAVITYLDGVETIDMKMYLADAAKDAAWIMPVPDGTDVSLGQQEPFDTLFQLTKPRPRLELDFSPIPLAGAGAGGGADGVTGAPPVSVDSVAVIGPFEVTTLSASDPKALASWLVDHGYTDQPDLAPTFAGYVARGWKTLAVKLTPTGGSMLAGDLDPLRMRFKTTEVVYPIELSKHARVDQDVRLYLLSDHKMAPSTEASTKDPLRQRFAGRLKWADVDPTHTAGGEVYVTSYTAQLSPRSITTDYVFTQAADDKPFHETYPQTVWVGWTWWILVPALLVGLAIWASRRSRGTRSGAGSPTTSRDQLRALHRSEALGRDGNRGLARLGRLGVRQRRRAPEAQGEGQGLLALTNLLAGVHVEQRDRFQQLACALCERRLHVGSGDVRIDDQRDVLLRQRERGQRADPTPLGRMRQQEIQRELDGAGALRQAVGRDDVGCNSPAWPITSIDGQLGAPARVPGRHLNVTSSERHAHGRRSGFRERHDVGPVGRDRLAVPTGGRPVARDDTSDRGRLGRDRPMDLGDLRVGGALGDAGSGRDGGPTVEVHLALLEQREVGQAA